MATHSGPQQGVEVHGSVVMSSYGYEVEGRRAKFPRRRPRFLKCMGTAALAVFACLTAIALLLSVCRDFRANEVNPGFARRRLSDNRQSAASSSKVSEFCRELAGELNSVSSPNRKHERTNEDSRSQPSAKLPKLDIHEAKTTGILPATSAGRGHYEAAQVMSRLEHQQPESSTSGSFLVSSGTPGFRSANERLSAGGFTLLEAQMPQHSSAQHHFPSDVSLAGQYQLPAVFVHPHAELRESAAAFKAFHWLTMFKQAPSLSVAARRQQQALQVSPLQSTSFALSVPEADTEEDLGFQGLPLPSTSSADSWQAFLDQEARRCEDRFCRLPAVLEPGHYAQLFHAKLLLQDRIAENSSIINYWEPVARLLCKQWLTQKEAEELADHTARLVGYITKSGIVGSHEGCSTSRIVALAHRFLILDTLVSALQILRVPHDPAWWGSVVAKFTEDYEHEQERTPDSFDDELLRDLKGGIETLKGAHRPSNVGDMKTKLFRLTFSPSELVRSKWNIWNSYNQDSHASQNSSNRSEDQAAYCGEPFCHLPAVPEEGQYAQRFDPQRDVRTRPEYQYSLDHNWETVATLLCSESLGEREVDDLIYHSENLVASIKKYKIVCPHGRRWKKVISALARRFLILDTLVSALHIVKESREKPWWKEVVKRFPEDYPTQAKPKDFNEALFEELKEGIAILKGGLRPPNTLVTRIKAKLLHLPSPIQMLRSFVSNISGRGKDSALAFQESRLPSTTSAKRWQGPDRATGQHHLPSGLPLVGQYRMPGAFAQPDTELSRSAAGFTASQALAMLESTPSVSETTARQEHAFEGARLLDTTSSNLRQTAQGGAVEEAKQQHRLPSGLYLAEQRQMPNSFIQPQVQPSGYPAGFTASQWLSMFENVPSVSETDTDGEHVLQVTPSPSTSSTPSVSGTYTEEKHGFQGPPLPSTASADP